MSGMPKRRARREAAAREAAEKGKAAAEASQMTAPAIPKRTEYTLELAQEICVLIADGTPLRDPLVNGQTMQGVCSLMGVSRATFYRWMEHYPEFRESVQRARTESADRFEEDVMAVSRLALDDPTKAHAAKVASDNYKWIASNRNRAYYGERQDLHVHAAGDLGERLRRALERDVTPRPDSVPHLPHVSER